MHSATILTIVSATANSKAEHLGQCLRKSSAPRWRTTLPTILGNCSCFSNMNAIRMQDSTAPTRDEATFFCERRARAPSFTRTVRRTSLNKNKLHPSREPRARNPQRLPKSEEPTEASRSYARRKPQPNCLQKRWASIGRQTEKGPVWYAHLENKVGIGLKKDKPPWHC